MQEWKNKNIRMCMLKDCICVRRICKEYENLQSTCAVMFEVKRTKVNEYLLGDSYASEERLTDKTDEL